MRPMILGWVCGLGVLGVACGTAQDTAVPDAKAVVDAEAMTVTAMPVAAPDAPMLAGTPIYRPECFGTADGEGGLNQRGGGIGKGAPPSPSAASGAAQKPQAAPPLVIIRGRSSTADGAGDSVAPPPTAEPTRGPVAGYEGAGSEREVNARIGSFDGSAIPWHGDQVVGSALLAAPAALWEQAVSSLRAG